jgi:hypothetical protein
MKRKIFETVVDCLAAARRWQTRQQMRIFQEAKPLFRRVKESPRRPFRQGNFVIHCKHDPHDRVAGDVPHWRDHCTGSGSTEQFC